MSTSKLSLFLASALVAVVMNVLAEPSPKRGIGFNEIAVTDLAALGAGVSWAYNWGVDVPEPLRAADASGIEFLPMVWGPQEGFRVQLDERLQKGPKPFAVLGLNEPNLRGQAFQSPSDAAVAFETLAAQCRRHGVRLVAPNMALGTPEADSWRETGPDGTETVYTSMFPYLDAFERKLRTDGAKPPAAIGVHVYGNIWELKWILGELEKRYPGIPVWVTEFNWSGAQTEAEALDYMVQAVDALERAPNIERYAWFKADLGDDRHSLVAPNGGLTSLGRLYVAMPHPDSKRWDPWPGVIKAAGAARVGTNDGASVLHDPEAQVVVRIGDEGSRRQGWFELQVDVAAPGGAGTLVLSAARGSTVLVWVDGKTAPLPLTPMEPGKWGFQDYATPLSLAPGRHVLRFGATAPDTRFDWIAWTRSSP